MSTSLLRYSAVRAGLIILAFLVLGPAKASAQVTVKMATLVPKGSAWHQVMLEVSDKWNKISGGRVKVVLFPGGTQGDDPDVVRKMNLKTLDAALLTVVGVAEIDRSVYALSVPMMFNDYDEVYSVLEKMRPKLEARMEAKGFVVLNWVDAGWLHFFTTKPVASPDDLRKLALFQWAGNPKELEIWNSAGFMTRPGASSDLPTGLKTGLYQAFTASPQVAVIMGYFQDASNMTDLNWALLLGATVIRKDVWDRVPADIKPALLQAQRDAALKLRAEIRQSAAKDVQNMRARGLNVVPVDARTLDLWRASVDRAKDKIRGDFAPADAYDEALRFRDEYRKSKPAPKK